MTDRYREVQQRIDYIMEENLFRAFDAIWDAVNDDKYTKEEAENALSSWDMDDFFSDWWQEGEDD